MPVFTTGSTSLSFTQQFLRQDPTKYVVGGRLYFYLPGTTTPVTGYKDANATLPLPNPYILEQDGRIPNIFFITTIDTIPVGYTAIRMRLIDADGVQQFDFDNIPLLGPGGGSGGGGGGDTTDPASVFTTGDIKHRYDIGAFPGWVRCNGLTIGAPLSGATERENADCQNLFLHLWNKDATLSVTGGRGANAQADWDALKQITLPDFSGCVLAGLDNMSGTVRGVLTTATFSNPGQGPTVLGARSAGGETFSLVLGNLPSASLNVTVPAGQGAHPHDYTIKFTAGAVQSGTGQFVVQSITTGAPSSLTFPAGVASNTLPALAGTAALNGSATPISRIPPTKLVTIYMRL